MAASEALASQADKGTNALGRFSSRVVGALPSVAESLVVGGAVGGTLRFLSRARQGYTLATTGAEAAALSARAVRMASVGAAALDGGTQSLGGTYQDAYEIYLKQETDSLLTGDDVELGRTLRPQELEAAKARARARAFTPALLAGLTTATLTAVGGARGAEAVLGLQDKKCQA